MQNSEVRSTAVAVLILAVSAALATLSSVKPAEALPSFARQTGQPCGKCHTDFPGLTPFGRRFKLGGYTLGGGPYQTTPFANLAKEKSELTAHAAKPASDSKSAGEPDQATTWAPPIAVMGILGFTHTQASLPPPTDPFEPNDNVMLSPFSIFWGGAVTDNIGAFAQLTYNAPPPGGFSDAFGHTWGWDNVDVRYANSTKINGVDVTYGITANNNPTVQDVWNTTPAWSFPYAASTIAPTPAAATVIDGTFAAHVGSVGGYAFINDILYLEASAYRTLDFHTQAFAHPLSPPAVFTHADVYPNFSVWGWEVISNRRRPGFTVLENVSPAGFRSAMCR